MPNRMTHPLFSLLLLISMLMGTVALPATIVAAPTHATPQQQGDDVIFLPLITDGSTQSISQAQVVAQVYFGNQAQLTQLANKYDVWEEAVSNQEFVTVLLKESDVADLRNAGYRVDVDAKQTAELARANHIFGHAHSAEENAASSFFDPEVLPISGFSCYRTVEETFSSMAQLAANNPTLVTWSDVGNTYDKNTAGGPAGYDMNVLKLTNSAIAGPKPKLMIISAIHAREYTTAELATRFAEYLINNYGIDADATWLLDYHEIHIMPQANPDGRKIAEGGVLWRKNRNPAGCVGGDYGVDLNRNSGFQWGGTGSSGNACSQTYRGTAPETEPEVQAIENYAASIFPDQRGPGINDAAPADTTGVFITIHSYSELVLYPWGWTNNPAPNNAGMATLGRKFGYFNGYEVCNDCLYIADGVTDDWTYGELGVASYTFELGTEFFQQCSIFEGQVLPDNLPALLYAAKAARRPYQTPSGPDAINLSLGQPVVGAGTPVNLTATIDDTRSNSNGQGTEPTQNIQAARYSIDTPSWEGATLINMTATDGTFNSTAEGVTVSIDTTGLSNGQHTIFVEGQDASGQWGVPTAIFLEIGTPPTTIFFDDFESNLGWITNPNGTDTATTGQWERGDPQETNSSGPKQLGTTVSGSNDLVTARLAGSSVGVNDIDNGTTSVRSPNIAIPASGDTTLSFSYYLAHTSNSSSADFLRVQVVGNSTQTVLEELGAANDDDGFWENFSTNLASFAGQTVYLLISAADASNGSIVEAGLDDIRITSTGTVSNQAPTANAGPAQTVTDSDNSGAENITLNGSASSDSDGAIVSYAWSATGVSIPTGATPSANFPVGIHNVTLTVTDDDGATDTDVVVITVNAPAANQAPTANAGTNQTVTDSDDSGSESITLNGSASSDSDGTIVSYAWSATGVSIPTGATPSANFPVGIHNVTLTVTDDDGATDTGVVVITVNTPVNQAPTSNAGPDQTVADSDDNGSESITLNGSASSDSDGTIVSYAWSATGVSIPTGATPSANFPVGVHNVTLTVTDDDGATDTDVVVITVNAPSTGSQTLYVSSTSGGSIGGVSFADEDVLAYDVDAGTWSVYIDGSDVGLSGSGARDVDALHVQSDGSVLLSLVGPTTIPNVGSVDDSDIVRFVPSSLGSATNGTFEFYFDASDVGLTTNGEDTDAIHLLANGNLIISTKGSHNVPGVSGADEDLLQFAPTSLGSTTAGTWTRYFDGSDVALNNSGSEDVYGVTVDEATGEVLLTTNGAFSVNGLSGDGSDIFGCTGTLGNATSCTFNLIWDGSAMGYGSENMDGFSWSQGLINAAMVNRSIEAAQSAIDSNEAEENDDVGDTLD